MLRRLPRQTDPNVLVGFETNDDAGVYLISENLALVQTVDFFTPIVDDAELYGKIAAANSLSDVYSMGGKPISALSIVGFPENGDPELMEQIIRGGLAKMMEAGCSVIGGHSIRNEEMLFGYAVTGVIDPRHIWRNVGARAGDALLLTKPIGTGVISTALKNGRASDSAVANSAANMMKLNREAAEALHEIEAGGTGGQTSVVHAATDVTGFGLLGHAREMAIGDSTTQTEPISLEINYQHVEYLAGAVESARDGFLPGGLKNNREFVGGCVEFSKNVPQEYRDLLFDPQTSGGLLVAIASDSRDLALAALARRGVQARAIGRVVAKREPLISVS